MKEFIILNIETIISFITMFMTLMLGYISKKFNIVAKKYIPIQNFLIMIIAVLLYWFAVGDFSLVIASGSPVATLLYDALHNLKTKEDS